MEDVIKSLGYLALGSRLKRLGERMQADVSRLARQEGQKVPASLMPALRILGDRGPTTVGDLAGALGIAQPGVTRLLGQLQKLRLISSHRAKRDQRQRMISLTKSGHLLLEATRNDLWPRIESAVAAICESLDGPLLDQLAQIEQALQESPLDQRAARKAGG